jgi:hypothetical protein
MRSYSSRAFSSAGCGDQSIVERDRHGAAGLIARHVQVNAQARYIRTFRRIRGTA